MYAGGLLATLLIVGLLLLVVSAAMIVSAPRNLEAPRPRENPSDVTRRLRPRGRNASKS